MKWCWGLFPFTSFRASFFLYSYSFLFMHVICSLTILICVHIVHVSVCEGVLLYAYHVLWAFWTFSLRVCVSKWVWLTTYASTFHIYARSSCMAWSFVIIGLHFNVIMLWKKPTKALPSSSILVSYIKKMTSDSRLYILRARKVAKSNKKGQALG